MFFGFAEKQHMGGGVGGGGGGGGVAGGEEFLEKIVSIVAF